MTVDDIRGRLAHIESTKDDDEHAHNEEDLLFKDVLQYLAKESSCRHSRAIAAEALKVLNIKFSRWRA